MNVRNFSVSMGVYGRDNPVHFEEALRSVFVQSIKPNEVILVVDGPVSDAIFKVIRSFEEEFKELKTVWLKKNVGHGNSRRIGLENCLNDIVALMDSDDICRPERFELQLKEFSINSSLGVIGGQIAEFENDKSNTVGIRKVSLTHEDILRSSRRKCPMNQMTVMFSKSKVTQAGGYLDWYCNEDYYLWIRMLQKGFQFRNINQVLVDVRVGEEMFKRRGGWKYFRSEVRLQYYLLQTKWISIFGFTRNVLLRFIVQIALPNQLRGFIFKNIIRTQPSK